MSSSKQREAVVAKLTPQQRLAFASAQTTRMLSANTNSAYVRPSEKVLKRPSETWAEYPPKEVPVDRTHFLKKDTIKEFVEKAMELHDERGGMPVVSSPIWAPKTSSKKG